MLFRVVSVAIWAAVAGASAAGAQSLADIGGPAEQPPAGYSAPQYVDSRGCVFLRAGYGGTTSWVPRVSRDRKVLCGYPPSVQAQSSRVAAVEAPQAPEPVGPPMEPVADIAAPPVLREATAGPKVDERAYVPAPVAAPAAAPTPDALPVKPAPLRQARTAQPVAAGCPTEAPHRRQIVRADGTTATVCTSRQTDSAPAAAARAVATATPGKTRVIPKPAEPMGRLWAEANIPAGKIGCPASAAVPRRFLTTDGGSTVLCTRPGKGLQGARMPILPAGTVPVGAARQAARVAAAPSAPAGYELAWDDGRLNPRRGVGTAEGQMAQDQLWTRDVPARLVKGRDGKPVRVSVSAHNAGQGLLRKSYVQVGTYAEPANAAGVKARLAAMGLPVAGARVSKAGQPLQIVFAGPFTDHGSARAALGQARGAGFGDAFIR